MTKEFDLDEIEVILKNVSLWPWQVPKPNFGLIFPKDFIPKDKSTNMIDAKDYELSIGGINCTTSNFGGYNPSETQKNNLFLILHAPEIISFLIKKLKEK